MTTELGFALGHQFKSREARDHFKAWLDLAEQGQPAVIRRQLPVVALKRDLLDSALARLAPFNTMASVSETQVTFWLDDVPVHAVGENIEEASEGFVDALIEYAEDWFDQLQYAENHRENGLLVQRIAMYADDREELRRVVFED